MPTSVYGPIESLKHPKTTPCGAIGENSGIYKVYLNPGETTPIHKNEKDHYLIFPESDAVLVLMDSEGKVIRSQELIGDPANPRRYANEPWIKINTGGSFHTIINREGRTSYWAIGAKDEGTEPDNPEIFERNLQEYLKNNFLLRD